MASLACHHSAAATTHHSSASSPRFIATSTSLGLGPNCSLSSAPYRQPRPLARWRGLDQQIAPVGPIPLPVVPAVAVENLAIGTAEHKPPIDQSYVRQRVAIRPPPERTPTHLHPIPVPT